jgi:hypothetical protein
MIPMTTVLAEMRANPETFLRHYIVAIAGGPLAQTGIHSGQATFSYTDRATTGRGFTDGLSGLAGRTKERPYVTFTKISGPAKTQPAAGEFNAWYIAMAAQGAPVMTRHAFLPGTGGPDIALTSKLSGCSFGVGSAVADGSRIVSHVQPPPGAPNPAVWASMRAAASSGVMDAVFDREGQPGADNYGNPANRATVIGIRSNGYWQLYAQILSGSGGTQRLFRVERLST